MREIDIQTWSRREHYRLYGSFDHPHFGLCANVDLTEFYPTLKRQGISITVGLIYAISRAANAIPEFRYRIRDGKVIEHEVVHPSATILGDEDVFGFCTIPYNEDFSEFAAVAEPMIARVSEHPTLEEDPGDDNLLFMTAIPWVTFTSFMHPIHLQPPDSIPRFAWGKFYEDGKSLKMPLGVQVHHGLMDGVHVGKFYTLFQGLIENPSFLQG